jgi:hypothetical protein
MHNSLSGPQNNLNPSIVAINPLETSIPNS